jgi:hypothetical protein
MWGSGSIVPFILTLDTRWRWVFSFRLRPLYSQGKKYLVHINRRLGGSQIQYSILKNSKVSFSSWETNRPATWSDSTSVHIWVTLPIILNKDVRGFPIFLWIGDRTVSTVRNQWIRTRPRNFGVHKTQFIEQLSAYRLLMRGWWAVFQGEIFFCAPSK